MKQLIFIRKCRRSFPLRFLSTGNETAYFVCALAGLLFFALSAPAQDADTDADGTYFHPAASYYIHGDTPAASNLVAQGLAEFPENGKLLRLKELLEQQQQNEDQNEDQQDRNQDQQDQNEDQQEQQDQNEDQQEEQDQQEEEQDQQEQNEDQQEQGDPQQPREQPSAEQMTQDEAEQLLDAMKQEEENKRLQLHPVMGAPVKVDKDW